MIIRTGYCRPLDYYWCSHDVASIIYYYLRNHAKTITYYLDTYKEALCIIPVVVCKAHKNNPLCQILEKIDDGAPLILVGLYRYSLHQFLTLFRLVVVSWHAIYMKRSQFILPYFHSSSHNTTLLPYTPKATATIRQSTSASLFI